MAVAQGYGKTVTSGSVFAYDVADTRNSYKGEPTTNHIWHQNPRIDASYTPYMPGEGLGTITQNHPGAIRVYNENGSDISEYINTGVGDWTNQRHAYWVYDQKLKRPVVRMYNENGSWQSKYYNPGIGSLTNIGVSAGTTYVISWLQYVESLDRSAYVGLYSYSNTNGYNNFWDGLQAAYNTQTHTWQRVSAIFTATNNGQLGNYHGGYTYGHSIGAGELRVADIQLEVKTHATQYSNSLTRSATQGLLPLVGNTSLDLTNVSFDSNAQMTFDGTDDYINLDPSICTISDIGSIEAIIKPQSGVNDAAILGWGNLTTTNWGDVSIGDRTGGYSDEVVTYVNISTDGNNLVMYGRKPGGSSTQLEDGKYHHIVVVIDGVKNTIYLDGIELPTISFGAGNATSQMFMKTASTTHFRAGWTTYNGGHVPFQGEIPVVKIYNRGLSAAEVRQNYLHYKTRFNLS